MEGTTISTGMEQTFPLAGNGSLSSITNTLDYSELPTEVPMRSDKPVQIITTIIVAIIAVTGIIGNSTVLFIIVRYKEMQNITNYFIANLAITDLSLLWLCATPTILNFIEVLAPTDAICKLIQYIMFVTVQATCCTLTAMTVDRYNLIVHAVKSRTARTTKKAIIISVLIWMFSLSVHLPLLILSTESNGRCIMAVEDNVYKWYQLATIFLMYIIPLTIILFCYTKILALVWRKSTAGTESAQAQERSIRQKKKITRMVFVVIMLFAICWLPIHLFNICREFSVNFQERLKQNELFWGIVQSFALCLSYANSCVNPFIYAFTTASFKKHFKRVLTFKFGDTDSSNERKTDKTSGYRRIGKFDMNSGMTCDTKV